MKKVYESPKLGTIAYEESFWTGKKTITVNNEVAVKKDRKTFLIHQNGAEVPLTLKGDYLQGVRLVYREESYPLIDQTRWYEYFLVAIPFLFVVTWGNIPVCVEWFPIVGGAVGGFISGVFEAVGLFLSKMVRKPLYKILIELACGIVAILLCYGIAMIILKAQGKSETD